MNNKSNDISEAISTYGQEYSKKIHSVPQTDPGNFEYIYDIAIKKKQKRRRARYMAIVCAACLVIMSTFKIPPKIDYGIVRIIDGKQTIEKQLTSNDIDIIKIELNKSWFFPVAQKKGSGTTLLAINDKQVLYVDKDSSDKYTLNIYTNNQGSRSVTINKDSAEKILNIINSYSNSTGE